MEYKTTAANDGTTIAYQTSQHPSSNPAPNTPTQCILLLHGFSGSSQYFTRNYPSLISSGSWILATDMRGHGRSAHTPQGYHVARLAMDLHDFISTVIRGSERGEKVQIYAVGCSIGAAVLWTYVELFTDSAFAGLVFVDQAPLQDRSLFGGWGAGLAHYACYDEASMLAAQRAWASEDQEVREETYKGLVNDCLGYRYKPLSGDDVSEEQRKEDEDFFTSISRNCDGIWLAKLLADHTRYDHREALSLISKPIMVMMGRRSGCFSVEAQRAIGRLYQEGSGKEARMVEFESGHWLFWEEPEKFNKELLDWTFQKSAEV